MPGPDPGIPDRCVFLNPGVPQFWLTDDVRLNPGTSPGSAHLGDNTVEVTVRKRADCAVNGVVLIDLYVSNPSVGVVPPGLIANASKKITNVIPTNPDSFISNGNAIQPTGQTFMFTWTIPAGTDPSKPDGPGHRCLVARCYPLVGSSPDTTEFHVQTAPSMGDQHVVQKNIEINTSQNVRMMAEFNAANFDGNEQKKVIVRTVFDARPAPQVLEVLLLMLRQVPGFRRITPRPPTRFSTSAEGVNDVQVRDMTRRGWLDWILRRSPTFEMDLTLDAAQLVGCVLDADLDGSDPGDAHVFHLTQREEGSELLQGGLTVVLVRE